MKRPRMTLRQKFLTLRLYQAGAKVEVIMAMVKKGRTSIQRCVGRSALLKRRAGRPRKEELMTQWHDPRIGRELNAGRERRL